MNGYSGATTEQLAALQRLWTLKGKCPKETEKELRARYEAGVTS